MFALYGGSYRGSSSSGLLVKGAVRVVQPFYCYYKGFSKKQIIKGKVARALISSQSYAYNKLSARLGVSSSLNTSVLVKKKLTINAKHALGPAFISNTKKKFNSVFRIVL